MLKSAKVCQKSPVAQLTGCPVEQVVGRSLGLGAPPCSRAPGPPATTDVAASRSSNEKYAVAPGARPPAKLTMPPEAFWLMFEKLVPGPSYPVGPNGHPATPYVHSPSLSNPNKSVSDDNARLPTVVPELFTTPIRVSSTPSNGPCVGSSRIRLPPSVICTNTAQLVSAPTGGHWLNGAVGADGAAAVAAAPVEGAAVV